jgi:DNA-binding transcriptional regulator GbsR (MarR family)
MSEEAWPEVQELLGGIGKHWELGESAWRIWGCILFKSCPISQKEIARGTGYSSGVVSLSLNKLKMANMIKGILMGGETRYYVNTSLSEAFSTFSKLFFEDNLKPLISLLAENMDKVEDSKVKDRFRELIDECKKLNLLVLIQSRIIEQINASGIPAETEGLDEAE